LLAKYSAPRITGVFFIAIGLLALSLSVWAWRKRL
jgi:hypothetical protein